MKISIYAGKNILEIEADLQTIVRDIDSGIAKNQLVPFKDEAGLTTYIAARNVDFIRGHEPFRVTEAPKAPEPPKQERIEYTKEQLEAQPLLALDAYGQRPQGMTFRQ